MNKTIGQKAIKSNPALKPFEVLVGEWKSAPGTLKAMALISGYRPQARSKREGISA